MVTLRCGWQPHGSDGPTPWDGDPTPVNLDAGKLKLSNQASRELDPRVTKLVIPHRFPRTAGENAQQTRLLIIERRMRIRRNARSVRFHAHVPNLRYRDVAIVRSHPIMQRWHSSARGLGTHQQFTGSAFEIAMPNLRCRPTRRRVHAVGQYPTAAAAIQVAFLDLVGA